MENISIKENTALSITELRARLADCPVTDNVTDNAVAALDFVREHLYNVDFVLADALICYEFKEHFKLSRTHIPPLLKAYKSLYKEHQKSTQPVISAVKQTTPKELPTFTVNNVMIKNIAKNVAAHISYVGKVKAVPFIANASTKSDPIVRKISDEIISGVMEISAKGQDARDAETVDLFIEQCCVLHPSKEGISTELYAGFKIFCEDKRMVPCMQKNFNKQLTSYGLQKTIQRGTRRTTWKGIALLWSK